MYSLLLSLYIIPTFITAEGYTSIDVFYFCRSYYFVDKLVSFETAKKECEELGMKLLSIESKLESDFINEALMSSTWLSGTHWWTSLKKCQYDDGYTMWLWTGENAFVTYENWCDDQQFLSRSGDCGLLYYNNGDYCWNARNCSETQNFICEASQDTRSSCPTNYDYQIRKIDEAKKLSQNKAWKFLKSDKTKSKEVEPSRSAVEQISKYKRSETTVFFDGRIYTFIPHLSTYQEAKEECARRQSALLSIETKKENDFINTEVKRRSYVNWWLSLVRNAYGQNVDLWQWEGSGKCSSYRNWCKDEPDDVENCTVLHHSSEDYYCWKVRNCNQRNNVICEELQRGQTASSNGGNSIGYSTDIPVTPQEPEFLATD